MTSPSALLRAAPYPWHAAARDADRYQAWRALREAPRETVVYAAVFWGLLTAVAAGLTTAFFRGWLW